MYYDATIYWNKGSESKGNTASLLVVQALTVRGRVFMSAVCGAAGEMGEYAGGCLTEGLKEWFYDGLPEALIKRNPLCVIRRQVERVVYRAQRRMNEYVREGGQKTEMTVSLLILWEKKYMLWNLGDNSVYRFSSDGRIKRSLTVFEMGTVKNKDAFLICTDAFIHKIAEHELLGVLDSNGLSKESLRRRLREIGEAAMRRGEQCGISALYLRISSHKMREKKYRQYRMNGGWHEYAGII